MNAIQQLFNEPTRHRASRSSSPTSGPASTTSRTTRPTPRRARSSCERADTLAASFNSISQSLTQQQHRHDERARRDRRASINTMAAVDRAAQPGDQGEHDRGPPRQRPRGPARPAREQARRRRAARRCAPADFNQVNVDARAAPRSCRTTRRSTLTRRHDGSGRRAALGERQLAARGHVGQGRRRAQRDQRDDPGLPRQARQRRDDAARPGQPVARRDQRLARGRRARTRARPATCSSTSRSTAARSRR